MQLKDKTVIITGASQGLGECLAYKVATEGAQVILVARNKKLLEKVQQNIIAKGGKAEYYICDIRILEEIKTTVQKIYSRYKSIDILVNNAGIWTDENLEQKNPGRRQLAFETNALGNIQFTQEVLPIMRKQDSGYIFNVISTAGVGDIASGNNVLWQTYGATKWAMTGFTKALKDSLNDSKIKVTGFFPGGFESNLYENAGRENPHNQPWMMKTEDIADIILFALTRPADVLMERIVVSKMKT